MSQIEDCGATRKLAATESRVLAVLGQHEATRNWYRIGREWWFADPPATELGEEEWAYFESRGERRLRKFAARAVWASMSDSGARLRRSARRNRGSASPP